MRKILSYLLLAGVVVCCSAARRWIPRIPVAAGSSVTTNTIGTVTSGNTIDIFTFTNTPGSGTHIALCLNLALFDATLTNRSVRLISSSPSLTWALNTNKDDGNFCQIYQYRAVGASASTTYIVTITADGGGGGGSVEDYIGQLVSLNNVDQTTPVGNKGVGSSTTAAPSVAVTIDSGDMAIGAVATDSESLALTTGTQFGIKTNFNSDVSAGFARNTGSGSTSISWSQANNLCSYLSVEWNHD